MKQVDKNLIRNKDRQVIWFYVLVFNLYRTHIRCFFNCHVHLLPSLMNTKLVSNFYLRKEKNKEIYNKTKNNKHTKQDLEVKGPLTLKNNKKDNAIFEYNFIIYV